MASQELQIYPDTDALFHAAAEAILSALNASLREKQSAALVLTGGKTPKPVYELLAASPHRERLDWKSIHFFWGDERCVAPDNPDSNFAMAWNALLSKIDVPPSHVHRIKAELGDAEKAAFLYEAEIRRILPGSAIPSFDLVLLGMGEDGHTASLFPGTQWDEGRLVVANFVPKLRMNRITMTPLLLNAARTIVFLTAGSQKAKALAGVIENPAADYPAKRIRPTRGSVIWMVDRAAASLLNSTRQPPVGVP